MLKLGCQLSVSALAVLLLVLVGCNGDETLPRELSELDLAKLDIENFEFLEEVESNREDDGTVGKLQFVDTKGETVRLDQFQGQQNILLVFTRGFSGMLCPFCTTQTSRLIANYDKFKARDTEVLLVYPGSKAQLPEFKQASMDMSGSDSFPFPVLLDEDLAAVKRLGIAAHLAYPSTFIIDKQGQVRLSYVGSNPADRPSIKALLSQLDRLVE